MSDPLTKEARAKQLVANVRLQAIKSFDSGAWNESATVEACDWLLGLVAEVERLRGLCLNVDHKCDTQLRAEIARLRARNEALEQVAKAAGEDHRHHTRPESDECAVCASLDALSALNPSDPNSSGGET